MDVTNMRRGMNIRDVVINQSLDGHTNVIIYHRADDAERHDPVDPALTHYHVDLTPSSRARLVQLLNKVRPDEAFYTKKSVSVTWEYITRSWFMD